MEQDATPAEPDEASRVVTVASLSPAWFLLRAFRLTASIVAVAIGLGKMSLPYSLWEKMREFPLQRGEDSEPCIHGRVTEPLVVEETMRRTGLKIEESFYMTDAQYPWLGATPDGYVKHDLLVIRADRGVALLAPARPEDSGAAFHEAPEALIECKAPYFRAYSGPPIDYIIQTYVQMRVAGIKVTYLTTYWANGRCMKIWRVTWCDKVWRWIERRMLIFMSCVYNGVRPTLTLLPHLYEATSRLVYSGFDPKVRLEEAAKLKMAPSGLIPDIPLETIMDLPDPFYYMGNQRVEREPKVV